MTTHELPPDLHEREVLMDCLEHAREHWLPLKVRAERAAGLNAEFNNAEAQAMERINMLLDGLGRCAVEGVEA